MIFNLFGAAGDTGAPAAPVPGRSGGRYGRNVEGTKYTVFLVEDDSTDRNIILQTLQRSPYVHNVHWFDSGDLMLRHFVHEGYYNGNVLQNIPTMVLLDVALPGTDGMEVLKRLKENPLTCEIPVVMISGNVTDTAARAAFKLKANGFIPKPLHLERVHEVMFTGWGWPTPPFGA